MKFYVYRRDTKYGADYQVTGFHHNPQRKAVRVGELEAETESQAAADLKDRLRWSLASHARFAPAPDF